MHIFPARFESGSTTPNYVVVSHNQVVEHWNPQSDHRWQVAMLIMPQALGIEKSVVDGSRSKFFTDLRESNLWSGPTSVRIGETSHAFCNSPVHEQWLLHVTVLVERCSPVLAAIVITLILQSQKLTALCCSAVYRFYWCAHYSTTPERSIQQSNRQLKPFECFSACSPVCASHFPHQVTASSNFFRCLRQMSVVGQRYLGCWTCWICVATNCMFSVLSAWRVLWWKTHDSVLLGFGCKLQSPSMEVLVQAFKINFEIHPAIRKLLLLVC
jgi:hypothetical protein